MTQRSASNAAKIVSETASATVPKLIKPRNVLKEKVREMPDGNLQDLLKAAEDVVGEQTANYPDLAYAQVLEMEAALQEAIRKPDKSADHIEQILIIAHDLKGDGQSFGFNLITGISHSLCGYIAGMGEFDDGNRTVIDAHISAIRAVIAQKVRGEGGDIGTNLMSALHDLVEKTIQSRVRD